MNALSGRLLALAACVLLCSSCAYDQTFGFPVEAGDIAAGRQAFLDHQCHACHSIAGEELPALAGASDVMLELGGETSAIRTYAGLMTSIINPDHEISGLYREQLALRAQVATESPMPMPHVDTMTVRQLIDLVAYLDSRYVLIDAYGQ